MYFLIYLHTCLLYIIYLLSQNWRKTLISIATPNYLYTSEISKILSREKRIYSLNFKSSSITAAIAFVSDPFTWKGGGRNKRSNIVVALKTIFSFEETRSTSIALNEIPSLPNWPVHSIGQTWGRRFPILRTSSRWLQELVKCPSCDASGKESAFERFGISQWIWGCRYRTPQLCWVCCVVNRLLARAREMTCGELQPRCAIPRD